MTRIGLGYDVHRLVKGRALVLGGVDIPYELGLLGHSDADVLTHAVMDAVLGAAGLGDIGKAFPDNDPALAGIPIIALSANVFESDIQRSMECGMNAHLKKPLDVPALLRTIEETFSCPQ